MDVDIKKLFPLCIIKQTQEEAIKYNLHLGRD